MFKLVAKIDNFDPRFYGEFQQIAENGTGDELKAWMEKNCPCDPETFSELWDDAIVQDPEYIITFRDLMCDEVSLYLIN